MKTNESDRLSVKPVGQTALAAVEASVVDAVEPIAPNPLPGDHGGKPSVRIRSMTWIPTFGGMACGGGRPEHGKPILTMAEAAEMLGMSRKRFENIIYEERVRLGRMPDFVCDAGGKIQRRIIRDELIEWVKMRRAKRGRPSKAQGRG